MSYYSPRHVPELGPAMVVNDAVSRVRAALRTLRAARQGNVAIIFALALIPVIGFAGAAIDYSRANSARSAMQTALDSTALMLSKEADHLSAPQLKQKANDYFNAILNRP